MHELTKYFQCQNSVRMLVNVFDISINKRLKKTTLFVLPEIKNLDFFFLLVINTWEIFRGPAILRDP